MAPASEAPITREMSPKLAAAFAFLDFRCPSLFVSRLPPRCALAVRPFQPMLLAYYLTVLGPFTVRTDGHFPTVVSVSLLAMDADGFRVSLHGSRAGPLLCGVVFAFCVGAAVLFYPATYGHDIRNPRMVANSNSFGSHGVTITYI